MDSRDMVIWRRLNCLKYGQNRKRPLFQIIRNMWKYRHNSPLTYVAHNV
ncbi:hypothetical protein AMTRI_Chr07g75090 [Amborella trichopoda]